MHSKFVPAALLAALSVAPLAAQAVHYAAPGLAAPTLLPSSFTVSTPKHCDELNGVVKLAAVIDATGALRDVKTIEASDKRLAGFAAELAQTQRFKPGSVDGAPASVAVELTLGLHTCAQRVRHPEDGNAYAFTLRAHPFITVSVAAQPALAIAPAAPAPISAAAIEQVGGHISAPVPIKFADPEYPNEAQHKKRHGSSVIGLVVGSDGTPQNIHVVKSFDPLFDQSALDAVKSWRFKPALKDAKTPVPVEVTLVAGFAHIGGEPVALAYFIPEVPGKIVENHAHPSDSSDFSSPVPLNADEVVARYYPMSRIPGTALVAMLIDTEGVTRNVHIVKSFDSSIDLDLIAMFEHERFTPAMKDDSTPIPITLILPVRYTAADIEWHNRDFAGRIQWLKHGIGGHSISGWMRLLVNPWICDLL